MQTGVTNYSYSVPNYPAQSTSFQGNATNKKSNAGAIAAGVTVAAGLALTAVAASKGQKITGEEKLLNNIKAGFNQIKDDVVSFAQTKLKQNTAEDTATQATQQSQITKGFQEIKDKITSTIKKGVDKAKEAYNNFKSSKPITYITEEGLEFTRNEMGYRGINIKLKTGG